MFERLLFKFVEYLPFPVLSILTVLWVYEKGYESPIPPEEDALSKIRKPIEVHPKPMMEKFYYWGQYHIPESDFYLGLCVHLDHLIEGRVIGMNRDYTFGTIDLSGKTVHDEKPFLSCTKISKGNHT